MPLCNVASLWEKSPHRNVIATRSQRGHVGVADGENGRKNVESCLLIGALKDSRIPQNGPNEVVHDVWAKDVRVVHLAFIFGLIALDVEDRVDGICECRLEATVILESGEHFVVVVEIIIDACGQQPFPVAVGDVASEAVKADRTSRGWNRYKADAARALYLLRSIDSRRGIVECENPLVERNRRRIKRRKTCIKHKVLKSRTGHENLGACPEGVTNSFRVRKEKSFVSLDWAAQRRPPLVVVLKRACCIASVVEEIVGAQRAASPVIQSVAVKAIRSRFRDVVNLSTRLTAVLSRIGVAYHRYFLNFIRTQQ